MKTRTHVSVRYYLAPFFSYVRILFRIFFPQNIFSVSLFFHLRHISGNCVYINRITPYILSQVKKMNATDEMFHFFFGVIIISPRRSFFISPGFPHVCGGFLGIRGYGSHWCDVWPSSNAFAHSRQLALPGAHDLLNLNKRRCLVVRKVVLVFAMVLAGGHSK